MRNVRIEVKQGAVYVTFKKAGKERTYSPTEASQKRLSALLWDLYVTNKVDIRPDPTSLTAYTAIVDD